MKLFLDSCIIVRAVAKKRKMQTATWDAARNVIAEARDGVHKLCVSTVTAVECLEPTAFDLLETLQFDPHFQLIQPSMQDVKLAREINADLRKRCNGNCLEKWDAVLLASAIIHGCDRFVTLDGLTDDFGLTGKGALQFADVIKEMHGVHIHAPWVKEQSTLDLYL